MRAFHRQAGILVFLMACTLWSDTTLVNTSLNYSVYLPDNWTMTAASDSQHIFTDTTGTYPALLCLARYHRDSSVYPDSRTWSRSHFLGYKLGAEYSFDPYGVVLYYDSSALSRQGSLWAPELYSEYYSVDSAMGDWAEYIRYPASGIYGYELYAISDTLDMETNIGLYAAILQGIVLPTETGVQKRDVRTAVSARLQNSSQHAVYDVRGRRCGNVKGTPKAQLRSGIYFSTQDATVTRIYKKSK